MQARSDAQKLAAEQEATIKKLKSQLSVCTVELSKEKERVLNSEVEAEQLKEQNEALKDSNVEMMQELMQMKERIANMGPASAQGKKGSWEQQNASSKK